MYFMGEDAEDILDASPLTLDQKQNYAAVIKSFSDYFVGRHNVIFERAQFNVRKQEPGESADSFITSIHKLAEHCNFGVLREELIRDRIVVGIRNIALSEKLQIDADLTLQKAVSQVKQSEVVKQQQAVMRGESPQAEELRSDNGPQFSSAEFTAFARDYDFLHVTSSPYFSQSNGEAERAVKTVKLLLLKNEEDPYRAMLAYRVTPLHHGLSPSELLMGRRLRSPLPQASSNLKPQRPRTKAFDKKDYQLKCTQAQNFDSRHRATQKPELRPGQSVWISPSKQTATVIRKADTPRSYVVDTGAEEVRRNRAHLQALPEPQLQPQSAPQEPPTPQNEHRTEREATPGTPIREQVTQTPKARDAPRRQEGDIGNFNGY
ncbi:uncharacterized protein [Nerophis lumbriciformis]|uniref:uncharacterized protein n=1 Tax=Nerophis lumbriciformis TaxID=546530 RepID=UPI003BAB579D